MLNNNMYEYFTENILILPNQSGIKPGDSYVNQIYEHNTTCDVHENCLIFKTPTTPVHLRPKFFHPLDLGRPILNEPARPSPKIYGKNIAPSLWTNKIKTKQKQNQVTSHSNWPRVLLFDLAHKQCNGIIKEWLYYLKPELIRRFFVNNKLMFDSVWDLVMAEIQFSLMKIIKIVRPEQSPPPTPYIQ